MQPYHRMELSPTRVYCALCTADKLATVNANGQCFSCSENNYHHAMYKIEAAVQFIVQKYSVVYKIKAVKGKPTAKANDEVKKCKPQGRLHRLVGSNQNIFEEDWVR